MFDLNVPRESELTNSEITKHCVIFIRKPDSPDAPFGLRLELNDVHFVKSVGVYIGETGTEGSVIRFVFIFTAHRLLQFSFPG